MRSGLAKKKYGFRSAWLMFSPHEFYQIVRDEVAHAPVT